MSIQDQVAEALKEAMKEKAAVRLAALRFIKAELMKLRTTGKDFTEEDEKAVLRRLVKQHKESLEALDKAGRSDDVREERERLAVVESFLPQQVTGSALEALVDQAIEAVGAASPRDMGRVMKHIKAEGVEADGRTLSEMVKTKLAALS